MQSSGMGRRDRDLAIDPSDKVLSEEARLRLFGEKEEATKLAHVLAEDAVKLSNELPSNLARMFDAFGWRSVFVIGGLASLAMIPLVYWRLPESIDFLLTRRPANALERINTLLVRMQHQSVSELPPVEVDTPEKASMAEMTILWPWLL